MKLLGETIVLKKLLSLSLLVATVSAHAVPNVWRIGTDMGFSEYSIEDANGRALWISCNEDAGPDYDNSAYLQIKDTTYENSDSEYPLTFLIDDETEVAPPASTNWRNGGNAWYDFTHEMAKAKKIDVYFNNKHITTFKPTFASIKNVASGLEECEPMSSKVWED